MTGSAEAAEMPAPAPDTAAQWAAILGQRQLVVFLDYDGTLTPIVDRPDLAVLSGDMRDALRRIGQHWVTAVISGRALDDVARLVDIDSLYYAGNHGFEIRGPARHPVAQQLGTEFVADMERAYRAIQPALAEFPGVIVEHKTYSLSVHYRLAPATEVGRIEDIVDRALGDLPALRKHHGKKVFEVRPAMDWDKGRAVLWLLEAMQLDRPDVLPLYIGDDITDEDAFLALHERGIGILVSESPQASAARYRLRDTGEVRRLLDCLAGLAR